MSPFDETQRAYVSLRNICAERTNKIVLFIGSGLSAAAEIPRWDALRSILLSELETKATQFEHEEKIRLLTARDAIRIEKNNWVAFRMLLEALGRTSFLQVIREQLQKGDSTAPPSIYMLLWKLNIAGILNLNLDRLATRAFSLVHSGVDLTEFLGRDAPAHAHVLKSNRPFVANLHGVVGDFSSWVFTVDQLNNLLKSDGYKAFINACFITHTVVFVGITASDVAVGGFLERLSAAGVDAGSHYWITSARDRETETWAQDAGVSIIRYDADSEHSQLRFCVQSLISYSSPEIIANPVVKKVDGSGVASPVPEELERERPEVIREVLNRMATEILASDKADRYSAYDNLCSKYDAAIHRAWYVKPNSPYDTLLGYKLIERVGEGAFGIIYRATAPNGETVALKLLHQAIREQPERLQGFRRGVRSMSILGQRHVEGVVPYLDAAEIPAFVVMQFIEGENLLTAVRSRRLEEWINILQVSLQVVRIIRRSHQLPERVLHRDIRPTNVMIQNYWEAPEYWQVVVLDFDLSWHRNAIEQSILSPGVQNGYLAPEMVNRNPRSSTRSAAVDAYGLGMTLYFLRTAIDPIPFQSSHTEWPSALSDHAARFKCKSWQSLPSRFFRLVLEATMADQSKRCDVVEIESELQRLIDALESPSRLNDAEMWAEELAMQASGGHYRWHSDSCSAHIKTGGLDARIRGNNSLGQIEFTCKWMQQGGESYPDIRKWLPKACEKIESSLSRAGWQGDKFGFGQYQFEGIKTISVKSVRANAAAVIASLRDALDNAQFS